MRILTIRREQMQALEDDAQKRMVAAHVKKFFPETAQGLTLTAWLGTLDAAISQAKSYGLRTHRDIEQYVVLAMTLGHGFEERKEFGWARDILHDRHPARAPFRATWVYERVIKQLAG